MIIERQMQENQSQPAKDERKLKKQKDNLVDFFQNSPHREVKMKIGRRKDLPREIDFK